LGGSAIPSVTFSRSRFEIYSKKNSQNERKGKDKNKREDFWPLTWGAGIKPYENEIVLTSNQPELELEQGRRLSLVGDVGDYLRYLPKDLGPTRDYIGRLYREFEFI
jgi:hypothetical protein